ncbi:MAG: hypothetical protein MZV49_20510 [Rhodopseudomonas palustris]|nr:hypothetical protein [Rhodopseudomonas palustris]
MIERIIRAATRKKNKQVTPQEPSPPETPPPPPKPAGWEDELYGAGDICSPEPDRDDEQRGL